MLRGLGVSWIVGGALLAHVAPGPEPIERGKNLTRHPAHQFFPAISGNRVVWQDWRFGASYSAIFLYDLQTGQQTLITPEGTDNALPAIHGDKIVYARLPPSFGDWQLYVYDIPTRTELQFSTISRSVGLGRFSISQDHVVWHTRRGANWDIYVYDIARGVEERITTDPADQADPWVDDDTIVWLDRRHGGTWWDVYRYDIVTRTETRVTGQTTAARGPVISGNRIVWGDVRGYLFSVHEYDLLAQTERRIPTSPIETSLSLSGDRLTWVNRNDDNPAFYDDVFAYDFRRSEQIQLTSSLAQQWLPALSKAFIVWEDYRSGDAEIYFYDLAQLNPGP